MNKLTQTLLTGSALCALMAAPAMAQPTHPAMHVMALHAGHVVNKTKLPRPWDCGRHTCYYSYGIYTSQPADAHKADLDRTYYKWTTYDTFCSNPKQKVKVAKKSIYARIDAGTKTYSFGCPSPLVFYGDRWTNKTGLPGNVDTFRSTLIGHWKLPNGVKQRGEIRLEVNVTIQ
jgi:hypothetical protein